MGVFDILKKKKKESKLDLPPPPPITKPIVTSKAKLILPKPLEVPKFKPSIPKFEIPKFKLIPKPEFKSKIISEPMPTFKPEFKPSFKSKIIPKFGIPKPSLPRFKPKIMPKLEKSYVDVDSFKDIISHVNEIKKKIKESEEVLTKLNEIKNKEDKEFGKWHSKFEDVQRKLVYIDRFLGG